VRAIDRPAEIGALPDCKLILARGPFSLADELALMQREHIETLVTKNSGGGATYAKIEAARALKIEVVIVRQPPAPKAKTLYDLDVVMTWIDSHRPAP
jgi:precorrin-6A/cobalt-precorrin-6A reductase